MLIVGVEDDGAGFDAEARELGCEAFWRGGASAAPDRDDVSDRAISGWDSTSPRLCARSSTASCALARRRGAVRWWRRLSALASDAPSDGATVGEPRAPRRLEE